MSKTSECFHRLNPPIDSQTATAHIKQHNLTSSPEASSRPFQLLWFPSGVDASLSPNTMTSYERNHMQKNL